MEKYLIIIGIIIILSLFMEKISKKLGVPTLLLFLLMGVIFGNIQSVNNSVPDLRIIEEFSTIALIFIMFYGGFGTNTKIAKKVIKKAFSLASIGVFITIFTLTFLIHFILKINIKEAFLISGILGSTDAASVFTILRNKNLSLKNNTDSLLEIESGSNDPFAYICTLIALLNLKGGFSISNAFLFLIAQVVIAILVALFLSQVFIYAFMKIEENKSEINQIVFISIALLSFALSNSLGGNGYLSTYIVGVRVGAFEFDSKSKMVHFFDGITSLMQLMLFFILGLLISPKELINHTMTGLVIMLFLTFVARPVSVISIFGNIKNYKRNFLVSFAGIRGAASIVFAMSAVNFGVGLENNIYHIIAVVVIFSLVIQGTFLPKVSELTDMIEKGGNILKTFNDYVEDKKVNFVESKVNSMSPWKNKKIRELMLPDDLRIILVSRNESNLLPDGELIINEGDDLILSGREYDNHEDTLKINQTTIDEGHPWEDKKISEIDLDVNKKLILIQRGEQTLIPHGGLVVKKDDLVLISKIKVSQK